MEKLPMCRICLVKNVRMFVVVNRNWQELYEKLTDFPFVTEDSRPILACFFCCAKLNQCYQLLRQCLVAEKLFAQMMNEGYEPNPLINQGHFEFYSGFIKSPTENISIVDVRQTESIAIKEELPAVCEGLDDIIEPQEEHQSDELEPENLDNSCLVVADITPHHSESGLEDVDRSLMEFKTEVEEEQEVSKKKRRARETKRTNVAKKPKLATRRTKLEDGKTAEQTRKDKLDSKVIRTTQKQASKPGATVAKKPNLKTRRTKLKDAITAEQTKKDKSDSIVIWTAQKRTSEPGTYFKEPYKCDQRSFNRVRNMTQHSRTHNGEKPYTCDICQRSFSAKGSLSQHMRIHTGEKSHMCDVCQRSFSRKGDLRSHIRIHTGEKPYTCDVCQRSFSRKGHLSTHIRIHTGEKPYKCDVCQRSFREKSDVRKHIRIHTGEKPYKCDVCQRSFTQKRNLIIHILSHSGRKPYKCDVCQRSFSEKRVLTKHMCIN